MKYLLGIDFGGGASKATLIDEMGNITAESTATISVCSSAVIIAVFESSPSYHLVEKPFITQTLRDELNENITITATGA